MKWLQGSPGAALVIALAGCVGWVAAFWYLRSMTTFELLRFVATFELWRPWVFLPMGLPMWVALWLVLEDD